MCPLVKARVQSYMASVYGQGCKNTQTAGKRRIKVELDAGQSQTLAHPVAPLTACDRNQ